MDIKEIKQIVELMKKSDLTEFEIQEEGLQLRICRNAENAGTSAPVISTHQLPHLTVGAPQVAPAQTGEAPAAQAAAPVADDPSIKLIKSPMVGTFYRAASPDNPPFAEKGARVSAEDTVCIIEAMKVMNEITADIAGTIVEVLVENGKGVEFGQPLFKVKV